ncbi:hypothetical protein [Tautonia sociabilis]|uniref:Glycosyltransferase RgtA/B/C/D-like domain-containing protein n=1 Tax=Tautonia sociabilis TaxID=2080755 RepID=A0A432MIA2_9BACT|nr:hypothetical protein [Tautonia sociabilis]RUL86928.1 hypothetical protein TsocGM_14895 [Tautonia sociabilis]
MERTDDSPPSGRPAWPSGRRLLGMSAVYAVLAVVGTWPAITTVHTALPGQFSDPLVHLWTMRWHKQCLLEGRLPFHSPGLQHPVGAPVGYLPPLQYQSLLYLGLSSVLSNDVLCYNIIWFLGFVLTGVGTYVLAWYVLRDGWAAALAGLLGMLGGPMTYFASGQVEQITLGWFPIFLVCWIRFVDRPSWGRLLRSSGVYLLTASSAPYYGVFAVFPAAIYLAWAAIRARRNRDRERFLPPRVCWLTAFVGLTLPALLVLFSSQIWAMTHGFAMDRSSAEFNLYKAPILSYLMPFPPKLLAGLLPERWITESGIMVFPTYLGLVTLGLLAVALLGRARFERSSYWWVVLTTCLVLSLGASVTVLGRELTLPAHWLREYGQILKPIRVPGRFAFVALPVAATIAGAGMLRLASRISSRAGRAVLGVGVMALATIDLAQVPFGTVPMPEMPACYRWIRDRAPEASIFEAPHFNAAWRLPALCTYWQSIHGLRTSAGYTADLNPVQENLLSHQSPFHAHRLAIPDYLEHPESIRFDVHGVSGPAPFDDFSWLYLKTFGFDYLVLHHRPGDYPELPVTLDALERRLAPALVFEDEEAAVYQVDRLPPPSTPVVLCAEGWRGYIWSRRGVGRIIDPVSRLALYNPQPGGPVVLAIRAMSRRPTKVVELREGEALLARWEFSGGEEQTLISPPLALSEGMHRLELRCDGVEPDVSHVPQFEEEQRPFALWVSAVGIGPTAELAASWAAGSEPESEEESEGLLARRPDGSEAR